MLFFFFKEKYWSYSFEITSVDPSASLIAIKLELRASSVTAV